MRKRTPLLPGIHLQTLRRKPRTGQQILAAELAEIRRKTIAQLGEVFSKFLPVEVLQPSRSGTHSRRRIFSKENTFWAFLGQVLNADGSCREVVKKLQAYAALRRIQMPSAATSAYCRARMKLNLEELEKIFQYSYESLENLSRRRDYWGRRVVVVDGTGVSMPDTQENQQVWPQPSQQKRGCGFPVAKILGCFSLGTGGMLSYEIGNKHQHELPLLRKQYDVFKDSDILLADKGFCSYYDMAMLAKRAVDTVVTLARRKPRSEAQADRKLGPDDYLIHWKKPQLGSHQNFTQKQWDELPSQLQLRQIKVLIEHPGFRTQKLYIVTTLLDADRYPAHELAELYYHRWQVELFFRDIKTTMGMDILRCKTPEMIHKEILMHLIAYNCVRRLMYEASENSDQPVRLISFKGSIQALRSWEPHLNRKDLSRKERSRLIGLLYEGIAQNTLLLRPGRSEPRTVKRRPKNYQRLTQPRHEMQVIKHRNRYRKSNAICA
jgi:IS4 transposase